EGSSSEDSLAGEQKDRDEDEEGDRHGDARGNAKRWEDINQNPKGEPAEEAAPHFPGTSEDDDHEADGSVGRADEWGNPDREPDGEEGAAGHGQRKSDCGSNRRDSSRVDSHELRSPNILAVRANRIAQIGPGQEQIGDGDDGAGRDSYVQASERHVNGAQGEGLGSPPDADGVAFEDRERGVADDKAQTERRDQRHHFALARDRLLAPEFSMEQSEVEEET